MNLKKGNKVLCVENNSTVRPLVIDSIDDDKIIFSKQLDKGVKKTFSLKKGTFKLIKPRYLSEHEKKNYVNPELKRHDRVKIIHISGSDPQNVLGKNATVIGISENSRNDREVSVWVDGLNDMVTLHLQYRRMDQNWPNESILGELIQKDMVLKLDEPQGKQEDYIDDLLHIGEQTEEKKQEVSPELEVGDRIMVWDISGDDTPPGHSVVGVDDSRDIPSTFIATVKEVLDIYDPAYENGIKYLVKLEDTDEVIGLYGGEWLGGSIHPIRDKYLENTRDKWLKLPKLNITEDSDIFGQGLLDPIEPEEFEGDEEEWDELVGDVKDDKFVAEPEYDYQGGTTDPTTGFVAPSSEVTDNICKVKGFCSAQGPITFGQLRTLVEAAIQKRIGADIGRGLFKTVWRIVPFFIPQVLLAAVGITVTRAFNKIITPALTDTRGYKSWWGKAVLKAMDVAEGDYIPDVALGDDPLSKIFFISDGLMQMIRDKYKLKFARYVSEVAANEPDDKPVPEWFVENLLRDYLNQKFLLDPPLEPKEGTDFQMIREHEEDEKGEQMRGEDGIVSYEKFTPTECRILKYLCNNFEFGELKQVAEVDEHQILSSTHLKWVDTMKLFGEELDSIEGWARSTRWAAWVIDNHTPDNDCNYCDIASPTKRWPSMYEVEGNESGWEKQYKAGTIDIAAFDAEDARDKAYDAWWDYDPDMETEDWGDWEDSDFEIGDVKHYKSLKEQRKNKNINEAVTIDKVQGVMDWAGILPVVGDIIDFINAIIYLARGKEVMALLSVIAIIPVVGSVVALPFRALFKFIPIATITSIISSVLKGGGKKGAELLIKVGGEKAPLLLNDMLIGVKKKSAGIFEGIDKLNAPFRYVGKFNKKIEEWGMTKIKGLNTFFRRLVDEPLSNVGKVNKVAFKQWKDLMTDAEYYKIVNDPTKFPPEVAKHMEDNLPMTLRKELVEERSGGIIGFDDEIEWFKSMNVNGGKTAQPELISIEDILKNDEGTRKLMALSPQEDLDIINRRYGTDYKTDVVYDVDPTRVQRYSELDAGTAAPSTQIDGVITFGVGRIKAAILRGDDYVRVWVINTTSSLKEHKENLNPPIEVGDKIILIDEDQDWSIRGMKVAAQYRPELFTPYIIVEKSELYSAQSGGKRVQRFQYKVVKVDEYEHYKEWLERGADEVPSPQKIFHPWLYKWIPADKKTISEHKESNISPELEVGDIIRVIDVDGEHDREPERFGVYKVIFKGGSEGENIKYSDQYSGHYGVGTKDGIWYELIPAEPLKPGYHIQSSPSRIFRGDTWIYDDVERKTISEHKESIVSPDLESGDIIRVIEIKDVERSNKPERFGVYKVQSKGVPPIALANESVAPWYEIVPYPEIGGLDSEYMKFNTEKYGRPDAKRIYWGDTWIHADRGAGSLYKLRTTNVDRKTISEHKESGLNPELGYGDTIFVIDIDREREDGKTQYTTPGSEMRPERYVPYTVVDKESNGHKSEWPFRYTLVPEKWLEEYEKSLDRGWGNYEGYEKLLYPWIYQWIYANTPMATKVDRKTISEHKESKVNPELMVGDEVLVTGTENIVNAPELYMPYVVVDIKQSNNTQEMYYGLDLLDATTGEVATDTNWSLEGRGRIKDLHLHQEDSWIFNPGFKREETITKPKKSKLNPELMVGDEILVVSTEGIHDFGTPELFKPYVVVGLKHGTTMMKGGKELEDYPYYQIEPIGMTDEERTGAMLAGGGRMKPLYIFPKGSSSVGGKDDQWILRPGFLRGEHLTEEKESGGGWDYIFGDSIAVGLSMRAGEKHPGKTGDEMLTKLGWSREGAWPSEIVGNIKTFIETHDLNGKKVLLSSGYSNGQDLENIRKEIDVLNGTGANLYLLGISHTFPKEGDHNEILEEIANEKGVTFLGGFDAIDSAQVHPNYDTLYNSITSLNESAPKLPFNPTNKNIERDHPTGEPDWSIRRGRQHYSRNVEDTPNEAVTALNNYLVKNSPFNFLGFDYYLTAVPGRMPDTALIDVFAPMLDTGKNADKLWSGKEVTYYEDLGIDDYDYEYNKELGSRGDPYIKQTKALHDIEHSQKFGEHYGYQDFLDGYPEQAEFTAGDFINEPGVGYDISWTNRVHVLRNEMEELQKLFGLNSLTINRDPYRPWKRQEDSYGNENIRPGKTVPRTFPRDLKEHDEKEADSEKRQMVQDVVYSVYPHIVNNLGKSIYVDETPQVELSKDIYARYSGIEGMEGEHSSTSKAEYDDYENKIFIYYPNMEDTEDVIRSLLHEYTHSLQDPDERKGHREEGYEKDPDEIEAAEAELNWTDYLVYLQDNLMEEKEISSPFFTVRLIKTLQYLFEVYDINNDKEFREVLSNTFDLQEWESNALYITLKYNAYSTHNSNIREILDYFKPEEFKIPSLYEYEVVHYSDYGEQSEEEDCEVENGYGYESGDECKCLEGEKAVEDKEGNTTYEDCDDDDLEDILHEDECDCNEWEIKYYDFYYWNIKTTNILSFTPAEQTEDNNYTYGYEDYDDFISELDSDYIVTEEWEDDDYDEGTGWENFDDSKEGQIIGIDTNHFPQKEVEDDLRSAINKITNPSVKKLEEQYDMITQREHKMKDLTSQIFKVLDDNFDILPNPHGEIEYDGKKMALYSYHHESFVDFDHIYDPIIQMIEGGIEQEDIDLFVDITTDWVNYVMSEKREHLNEEVNIQDPSGEYTQEDYQSFINFVIDELDIKNPIDVIIQSDIPDGTTAKYTRKPEDKRKIIVKNNGRKLIDMLRSIAHELVHHKQNEIGKVEAYANQFGEIPNIGGEIEDEANAIAGQLIKKYGEIMPQVYNENIKKDIIKKILRENLITEDKVVNFDSPTNNFVVIAGGPGAGKSFITKNLINLDNVKEFNVDQIRVMTAKNLWGDEWEEKISTPEGYQQILDMTYTTSDPRNLTVKYLKHFLSQDRDQLVNVVYDAGGGQEEVMKDVHKIAKDSRMVTNLIYVRTPLELAQIRNNERPRSLPDDMVAQYHQKVKDNMRNMIPFFDHVWIIDNKDLIDLSARPSENIEKIK